MNFGTDQLTQVSELQRSIASALRAEGGDGSTAVSVFYGRVSEMVLTATYTRYGDGRDEQRETSDEVVDLLEQLRDVEASDGNGAWISVTLTLQDGTLSADVNWDRRIYQNPADPFAPGDEAWMRVPDDEDWRSEFRAHPRSADAVPEWAVDLVPTAADDEATKAAAERLRAALTAAKGTFPESLAALKSAWGWPDIWEGVQEHLDGALSVARTSVLSRLSSDRATERESAITSLAQDTWDRAYTEFFDERENQFLLDVFESLPLVRPQAASLDTTRIDPKATFALKGNEDVFRVFDVVDSVLGEMIDAELDQRLAQV